MYAATVTTLHDSGTSSLGPGEDILYVACHGEISSSADEAQIVGGKGFVAYASRVGDAYRALVIVNTRGESAELISGELVGPAVGVPSPLERKLEDWLQFLEPGEHRVQMIGRLPDGRALASNTLLVDLPCGAPGAEPREVASYADESAAARDSETAGCTVANARASGSAGMLTLMLTCLACCAARMRCRARIREARRVERCGCEVAGLSASSQFRYVTQLARKPIIVMCPVTCDSMLVMRSLL